uniref:Retrovirus-related Pol polyprotein from transposon TNT 1-94 n=1 Tax=Rhizophora mucronata TaxID=61149 RepID=A0A2P2IK09_RHIMU
MIQHGHSLHFAHDFWKIYDFNNIEIANAHMENKSFLLKMGYPLIFSLSMHLDETNLWCGRFRHHNLESLKFLQSKNLVRDIRTYLIWLECVNRVNKENNTKSPIYSSTQAWRVKEKLALVRTNICGAVKTKLLSQNTYFVHFTDGYITRMT